MAVSGLLQQLATPLDPTMLDKQERPTPYIVGHSDKAMSVARRAQLHDLPLSSGRELPPLSFPGSKLEYSARDPEVYSCSPPQAESKDLCSRNAQYPYMAGIASRPSVRLPSYSDLERNVAGKLEEYGKPPAPGPTVFRGTWRESFHSRERGEYLRQRHYPSLMAKSSAERRHDIHPYGRSREYPTRLRTPSRTLSPWSAFPQSSRYNMYMQTPARHSSYPSIDRHDWSGTAPLTSATLEVAAPSRYQSSPEQKHLGLARASPTGVPSASDDYSSASVSPTVPAPSEKRGNSVQSPPRRTESNGYPRRRGKLPKAVIYYLKTWLLEHEDHPYPTEEEKRGFCETTGLDISQVSNWFVNARRRILAPQQNAAKAGA